jgi:ketosteroid isomerase-like protein
MFGTRSQSFVRQFLCCLILTIGCTAFAFAADTDAWLTHFVETLNAGMPPHDNAGAIADLYAPNAVHHSVNVGPPQRGRAQLEAFFASFKDRWLDWTHVEKYRVVQGNRAVWEGTGQGHDRATGMPIKLPLVFILEFNDGGKVLEERVYVDRHLVAEQVAHENTAKPEAPAIAADVQRGRLLYETHCIACHTTQAHWRDKHIVRSWADLLYQVTRMQNNAGQEWSMTEIIDVAAYLNELFYKTPCPVAGCRGSQARVDVRTALARDR